MRKAGKKSSGLCTSELGDHECSSCPLPGLPSLPVKWATVMPASQRCTLGAEMGYGYGAPPWYTYTLCYCTVSGKRMLTKCTDIGWHLTFDFLVLNSTVMGPGVAVLTLAKPQCCFLSSPSPVKLNFESVLRPKAEVAASPGTRSLGPTCPLKEETSSRCCVQQAAELTR